MKKNISKMCLLPNGTSLSYCLRRSRRARNILLNVNMLGEVEIVIPWYIPYASAEKFIQVQARWLQQTIASTRKQRQSLPKQKLTDGSRLPIFGDVRLLTINVDRHRIRSSYQETGDDFTVNVNNTSQVSSVIERWYRHRALIFFQQRITYLAPILGVKINQLVISGAKTQWGSCIREKGRLSIQWRLAQAPLDIIDYVLIHELAHLRVKGHSHDFWQLVESVCPQYRQHKKWLRENSYRLYW